MKSNFPIHFKPLQRSKTQIPPYRPERSLIPSPPNNSGDARFVRILASFVVTIPVCAL